MFYSCNSRIEKNRQWAGLSPYERSINHALVLEDQYISHVSAQAVHFADTWPQIPMITSIAPILEAFVVVGTSDSWLQICRFPTQVDHDASFGACDEFLHSSPITSLHKDSIGKCSRLPVSEVSGSGDALAAASAATLSTWDLVKCSRLRYWSTPDHCETCHHITPNLLAVAGHGRQVHFYDIRILNSKPTWSLPLSQDNLYTICGAQESVFAAGADGLLYKADLRNAVKTLYDFSLHFPSESAPRAILGLSRVDTEIVMLFETGDVLSLKPLVNPSSEEETHVSFRKSTQPAAAYTTHVGCSAFQSASKIHVATGSERGHVNYFRHDVQQNTVSHVQRLALGLEACTKVLWGPSGLYAGLGGEIVLFPFSE